jgi:hypothetical protein
MRRFCGLVLLCIGVHAANADEQWTNWYYKTRQVLGAIDDQIEKVPKVEDQACPALEQPSQALCLDLYETVRLRRIAQRHELDYLLEVAHSMQDPERNKLLVELIPVYQRDDADIELLYQKAQKMFPPTNN